MLHLCSGDHAIIPKQDVQAGTQALLNTMGVEDVIGDAPKAADWVRPSSHTSDAVSGVSPFAVKPCCSGRLYSQVDVQRYPHAVSCVPFIIFSVKDTGLVKPVTSCFFSIVLQAFHVEICKTELYHVYQS